MLFSIIYEVFCLFLYAAMLIALFCFPESIKCAFYAVLWVRDRFFAEQPEYDENGDYIGKKDR